MIEEDIQQEINKAINMIGQNKLSEAEIVCHEILSQEKNADAYHILSSIKIYKREFKDSIELVKSQISIDNTNADISIPHSVVPTVPLKIIKMRYQHLMMQLNSMRKLLPFIFTKAKLLEN